MAKPDTAAAPSVTESPELANLRFREKELVEKAKKLDAHPDVPEHDIVGSKDRNALALRQVRDEIKRLSK